MGSREVWAGKENGLEGEIWAKEIYGESLYPSAFLQLIYGEYSISFSPLL